MPRQALGRLPESLVPAAPPCEIALGLERPRGLLLFGVAARETV